MKRLRAILLVFGIASVSLSSISLAADEDWESLFDGKMLKGGRQTIYFAEYDGPLSREYVVQVLGE